MPLTLLLVADDPKLAGPLTGALTAQGYTVVRAASAEAAVHELRAACFSLIVVDAQLSGASEAQHRSGEAQHRSGEAQHRSGEAQHRSGEAQHRSVEARVGMDTPRRGADVRLRAAEVQLRGVDAQLRGQPGLGLLQLVRPLCPATACVLLLSTARPPAAARALRDSGIECIACTGRGAQRQELLALCQQLAADLPLYLPSRLLLSPRPPVRFGGLVACSDRMLGTMEQARRAAALDCGVFLVGEKGSGKRLLGQALHGRSRRAGAPFVTLSTEQSALLLLGEGRSERGAGLERAALLSRVRGGTAYVRTVEAIGAAAQARLLACLEGEPLRGDDGAPVDLRLLVGTTVEPEELFMSGLLRPELYDHLAGCMLHVPPLRERERDILLLAAEQLRELDEAAGGSADGERDDHGDEPRLSVAAQRLLALYAWPGNVRELRAAVLHASQQAGRGDILPVHLPGRLREQLLQARFFYIPVSSTLASAERAVVLGQLALNDGNRATTAEVLGISRRSLYSKLAEYQRQASDSAAEDRPSWSSYGEAPPVHPALLALHTGDPRLDRYLAPAETLLDELLGDEGSDEGPPRRSSARSASAA
ncbi:MAG: sigma 54-interacting transcriptional regulator [Polyangia bacterium]